MLYISSYPLSTLHNTIENIIDSITHEDWYDYEEINIDDIKPFIDTVKNTDYEKVVKLEAERLRQVVVKVFDMMSTPPITPRNAISFEDALTVAEYFPIGVLYRENKRLKYGYLIKPTHDDIRKIVSVDSDSVSDYLIALILENLKYDSQTQTVQLLNIKKKLDFKAYVEFFKLLRRTDIAEKVIANKLKELFSSYSAGKIRVIEEDSDGTILAELNVNGYTYKAYFHIHAVDYSVMITQDKIGKISILFHGYVDILDTNMTDFEIEISALTRKLMRVVKTAKDITRLAEMYGFEVEESVISAKAVHIISGYFWHDIILRRGETVIRVLSNNMLGYIYASTTDKTILDKLVKNGFKTVHNRLTGKTNLVMNIDEDKPVEEIEEVLKLLSNS